MPVDVQNADLDPGLPGTTQVTQWVNSAITGAGEVTVAEHTVCVRYVDAVEGRELNATWRGKPQPTNVLSFPADLPAVMQDAAGAAPPLID